MHSVFFHGNVPIEQPVYTIVMDVTIEESWKKALQPIFEKAYFSVLTQSVRGLYMDPNKTVYPQPAHIFEAFTLCPFDNTSVVILGQDPYHGPGQAHGLSFSVPPGVRVPPSLKNIFIEIGKESDSGDLTNWATQGVFLLNSILTVERGKPASHHTVGWEQFTDDVIQTLSDQKECIVFMLWGNFAKQKSSLIDGTKHLVLQAAHPSPFSAHNGFFGSNHFSRANEYLEMHEKPLIKW